MESNEVTPSCPPSDKYQRVTAAVSRKQFGEKIAMCFRKHLEAVHSSFPAAGVTGLCLQALPASTAALTMQQLFLLGGAARLASPR